MFCGRVSGPLDVSASVNFPRRVVPSRRTLRGRRLESVGADEEIPRLDIQSVQLAGALPGVVGKSLADFVLGGRRPDDADYGVVAGCPRGLLLLLDRLEDV